MNLRRGHIIAVEFLDHVENGGNSPMRFIVYGRLSSITRSSMTVDCWAYANRKTKRDQNVTRYTIMRSAIKSVTRLVPTG